MADSPTLWCPSCGAEYRPGYERCAECRVLLSPFPPKHLLDPRVRQGSDLIAIGEWPRLQAQILRARLETAGVNVLAEWSALGPDAVGTLTVPGSQSEFAAAVINEIEVSDEVPDTSPYAYVTRIEEHLSAVAELMSELRTRLDELEG